MWYEMQSSKQCTKYTEVLFGREMHELMWAPFLLVLVSGVNVVGDAAV